MGSKKEITPTGILLLLFAFVGGLLGMNLNFAFLWIPCFVMILYFIPYLNINESEWNISAQRIFSASTITLGGFLHLELQITNNNSVPQTITIDNKYDEEIILIKGWTLQVVELKPGEKKKLSYIFTVKKRGKFKFHPLRIYKGDYLGLYRNKHDFEDIFQVQVIPSIISGDTFNFREISGTDDEIGYICFFPLVEVYIAKAKKSCESKGQTPIVIDN